MRCVWEAPGVTSIRPASRQCAAPPTLGISSLEMVSGAGHDSCNVSAVVPTAMVFVPVRGRLEPQRGGERQPGDLEAGANVLLHAMLSLAKPAL